MPVSATVAPVVGDTWVDLVEGPLPVGVAAEWAVRPDCGALVLFSGTARDHSAGRTGVRCLTYESYEEQAIPRLVAVADEARARWPALGRLVLLHRTGDVGIGDAAVVVVATAPHRPEAFAGARYCIDALKMSVPVWKAETRADGRTWGPEAQHLVDPGDVPAATAELPR